MAAKKWRINYCITYQTLSVANIYRKPALDVLKNVAFLKGIDCAIEYDRLFEYEPSDEHDIFLKALVSDIVYFRSSRHTKVAVADFRKLIDHIFEDYRLLKYYSFEIFSLPQKSLPQYPFPV
ncbi:hypothetical protein GGR21_000743 [Dysgonomonas hofstadii]|uniref:Uncharacterized protein n=1 Tax=Dysgonomonas hofstadii TaxID=637886 RepID=A0A840CHT6_9BACT|nr:hypothetical protein [Dysgonomonas hofstadii]MBB4034856.1 hypothetical protein [Dysgonomonas hofstadii]